MSIRESINAKADIVKFIGKLINLEPTGGHFQGVCPCCDELYPTLNVYSDEGRFECFLCGAAGDVLDFAVKVLEIEDEETAAELISSVSEIELTEPEVSKTKSKRRRTVIDGLNIVEGRTKIINAAQDFKAGIGYVSVMLKVERIEKGKRSLQDTPHVVTSERKIIPIDNQALLESQRVNIDLYPELPQSESRWPYPMLSQYLKNEVQIKPGEILTRLAQVYDRFLDFTEVGTSLILAVWSMGTYFYKLFESYPYLYIHGTKGSGKTKCLLVARQLSFNSLMASDITKAALFRTVEGSSPTVFIDEAEHLKGRKMDEELVRLLNAGYKRGNTAVRVDTQTFKVQRFDLYSPKMLAGIKGLDSVLEDRCIELTMIKTMDPLKGNLVVAEHAENWGEIRHLLYCFALDHFGGITASYEKVVRMIEPESVIQGRKGELWFPLLSIAFYVDSYGQTKFYRAVKEFAERSIREAEQDSLDEWSTALLLALECMFKDGRKAKRGAEGITVRLSQVEIVMRRHLEENNRAIPHAWIGNQLKRWRLGTKKRTRNGMEYIIEHDELKDRMRRYLPMVRV